VHKEAAALPENTFKNLSIF